MKFISYSNRITYGVVFLVLLSTIEAGYLYAQGSYFDPKRLEILAQRGGYITSATLPQYMIYRSKGESEIIGEGDIVFLNVGSNQGIKPGDLLRIFRTGELIIHPVTKEELGNLIKAVGALRLTETNDTTSTAIITDMYDNPVLKGDRVMPLAKGDTGQVETAPGRKREKGVTGYIVAISNERQYASQGDIVYIDRGKADTVTVGDTFNIRPFSRLVSGAESQVGQLRIISVQEKTATAIISRSGSEIAVGDMIVE